MCSQFRLHFFSTACLTHSDWLRWWKWYFGKKILSNRMENIRNDMRLFENVFVYRVFLKKDKINIFFGNRIEQFNFCSKSNLFALLLFLRNANKLADSFLNAKAKASVHSFIHWSVIRKFPNEAAHFLLKFVHTVKPFWIGIPIFRSTHTHLCIIQNWFDYFHMNDPISLA